MKKIYLFLTLLISVCTFSQNKISGVVTYYFNEYQGNKPDIGSEVYLTLIEDAKGVDIELLNDSFKLIQLERLYNALGQPTRLEVKHYEYSLKQKKRFETRYKNKKKPRRYSLVLDYIKYYEDKVLQRSKYLQKINEITSNYNLSLKQLLTKALEQYVFLTIHSKYKTVVDGVGSYSLNCKKGSYFISIKSANRDRTNVLEGLGQKYISKVTIIDEDVNISHHFSL